MNRAHRCHSHRRSCIDSRTPMGRQQVESDGYSNIAYGLRDNKSGIDERALKEKLENRLSAGIA